jgi:hypothetical protein
MKIWELGKKRLPNNFSFLDTDLGTVARHPREVLKNDTNQGFTKLPNRRAHSL